jgi:hypothetical protein
MIIWLLLLSYAASAKFIKGTVHLTSDNPWQYLTKFGMDIGSGNYTLKARLQKGPRDSSPGKMYDLQLNIYLDETWEEGLYKNDCSQKQESAKRINEVQLPADGSWSEDISGVLSQKIRPHVWYFTFSDCNDELKEKAKIKYELTILNSDGSHLSVEHSGLPKIYNILMLFFFIFFSANIYKLYKVFTQQDAIETTLLMVNSAVLLQFLGLLFETLHLNAFAANGKGFATLDFLSQASNLLSQLILISLLILIAEGWTIKFKQFPNPEMYMPVIAFIAFIHFLAIGLGRITDDSHYKFSDYEGFAGMSIVLMRMGLFGWFIYNVKHLYTAVGNRAHNFLHKFTISSSIYFLSIPILAVGSLFFAQYYREKVIVAGTIVVQGVMMLILSLLFTSRGEFFKISTMSSSVLPGKIHSF